MRGQPCERLSAGAPHAQQERVAQRLPDDPGDAADVLDGVHEEDEAHLGRVDLVVLLQVILQLPYQLPARVGQEDVRTRLLTS